MKIDYVNYLNESEETLILATAAYRKATADMEDLQNAYKSRVAAERHFSEGRKKTLVEIINDKAKTATVRAMAQSELDDMQNNTYPPTPAEERAYQDALAAAWESLSEIKKTKEDAKVALNAVKKELERDEKTIFSEAANVDWLTRMLQNDGGLTA